MIAAEDLARLDQDLAWYADACGRVSAWPASVAPQLMAVLTPVGRNLAALVGMVGQAVDADRELAAAYEKAVLDCAVAVLDCSVVGVRAPSPPPSSLTILLGILPPGPVRQLVRAAADGRLAALLAEDAVTDDPEVLRG